MKRERFCGGMVRNLVSENRYVILEEVQELLRLKNVEWQNLFKILCKVDDGYLEFTFGDVTIQFTRGFGVWSEDERMIQLSIVFDKNLMEETVTLEYDLKALEAMNTRKYSNIEGFGER